MRQRTRPQYPISPVSGLLSTMRQVTSNYNLKRSIMLTCRCVFSSFFFVCERNLGLFEHPVKLTSAVISGLVEFLHAEGLARLTSSVVSSSEEFSERLLFSILRVPINLIWTSCSLSRFFKIVDI